MNQIIPYPLWIGHAGDGRDLRGIFANGIQAIVQVAVEEAPLPAPRELIYLRYPLQDGEGNEPDLLRLAIGSVGMLMERKLTTLVCCGAGASRSPIIVAAALALHLRIDFRECLRSLLADRAADVSPALFLEVEKLLKEWTSTIGEV